MRLGHLRAFRPGCPVCSAGPLILAETQRLVAGGVDAGILHCPAPACRHEYPIVDGIPVIVPDIARLLADRGVEVLLRADLPPAIASLLGDALGPDSWFDALRQAASTYAWDAYADLLPPEPAEPLAPGAARRCLARLLALGAVPATGARALDLGCAAGRTSFCLAAHLPHALVLGVDTAPGLLRIAQNALAGRIGFAQRRIGLVYDQRHAETVLPGADRVDFWVMDARALPLPPASIDVIAALNLLDCVAEPQRLLADIAALLVPDGRALISTPFDWAARATQPAQWIGGHSQRADHGGAAEGVFRALADRHFTLLGEDAAFAWHTRLHARAAVHYTAYLAALARSRPEENCA